MDPTRRRSLEEAILELQNQQSEAIKDAIFVGWTDESKLAFEERRKRINELSTRLAAA